MLVGQPESLIICERMEAAPFLLRGRWDKVLEAVIPRNVRVSEAPSYGQSVMTYDPGSRGATSYFEAAQEIAERGARQGAHHG